VEIHLRKNSCLKKFMSVFLSLTVMVGVVSASGLTVKVKADHLETEPYDATSGFNYFDNDDFTGIVLSCFDPPAGFNGDLQIPPTIEGKPVVKIESGTFCGCDKILKVTIPNTITKIEDNTFDFCKNITEVNIPSTVTSIGEGVFNDCTSLTNINVDAANTKFKSVSGVLYSADGKTLFAYPKARAQDVNIPAGITTINGEAFQACKSLIHITIPAGVTSIGYRAFKDCEQLPSIDIPMGVSSIDEGAFCNCVNLTKATIPNSVKSIGENAFGSCTKLTDVTLPNSIESIGNDCFSETDLTSITIPSSLKSIGESSFDDCSHLAAFSVDPSNPTYTSQDGVLYSKDGKTLIAYPNAKTGTFEIPSSVTAIGSRAFWAKDSVKSITIPSSVTYLGDWAFGCTSLTHVTFKGKITNYGEQPFAGGDNVYGGGPCSSIVFTVPVGMKGYYNDLFSNGHFSYGIQPIIVEDSSTQATPASSASATTTSAAPATIKDSASGATVVGVNGTIFGANTTMSVIPVSDAKQIRNASGFLITAAGKNAALAGMQLEALYQINLKQNGVLIEPNGKVRVTMPLPASLKGLKNLNMVRFNDDGTVTLMNAVSDGTTITFETDHFSTYGIVETQQAAAKPATANPTTKNSATGDNSPIMPLATLVTIAAVAFALAVAKKKRCTL